MKGTSTFAPSERKGDAGIVEAKPLIMLTDGSVSTYIFHRKFALKIQKEPPIAEKHVHEVKVAQSFVELRHQRLNQHPAVIQIFMHAASLRIKVLPQTLH